MAMAIHEIGTGEEVSKGNGSEVPTITAPLELKADKINNSKKHSLIFIVKGFLMSKTENIDQVNFIFFIPGCTNKATAR